LDSFLARSVSVVGARAATAYGEYVSAGIAAGLADHGVTVVSGAAYGIDGSAHRGALSGGGPTAAVLACGLDRAYPQGHRQLIERMAAEGMVLTEVPPGSAPTRWRFLERNRLIAALSEVTVVVEAAHRSGALGTAGRAGRLSRIVAAVPGPVTSPASAGCHDLLRDGAVCVTDAAEVLELLSAMGEQLPLPVEVPTSDHDGLAPADIRLLDALPVGRGAEVTSLARVACLTEAEVWAGLGRLEVRGVARRTGTRWRRHPPQAGRSPGQR
jgi:DNA processing protein